MKTSMIAVIVIVIVIIIAGAAIFALSSKSSSTTSTTSSSTSTSSSSITPVTSTTSTPSSSSSTTSSVSSVSTSSSSSASGSADLSAVQTANNQHISYIESRNVPQVLTQYQSNAVVAWSGNTGGLGGTYTGTGEIQILYAGALASAKTIALTVQNYTATALSSTNVNTSYGMLMTGSSPILGNITGHILVEVSWVNNGTAWNIKSETWDYVVFDTTVSGGATTFPQWHTPSRESPDAFKNFVFHIGGPAYALVIFGYAAVVVALFLAFMFRRFRATPVAQTSVERKAS